MNYTSREKIRSEIEDYKLLNSEIAFIDPVYLNLDLSLTFSGEKNKTSYKDYTELHIVRNPRMLINEEDLKTKVFNIITKYINNIKLGDVIDVRYLNNEIEKIPGLEEIKTVRTDLDDRGIPGLSLCIYNPIYNGRDIQDIDTRYKLKPYQIPYIENSILFKNKIKVTSDKTKDRRVVEY